MAINDLFQALQMFQQGVQQYAITGAVNDANAQMQALNQAQIDEGQKRQQLQQLANGVALKLTGVGASGTQIQSAFNAINPQAFGSVEQMQLEGELAGNQQLTGVAGKILGEREAKGMRAEDRQFARQLQLQDREFERQLMLAQLKARGERAAKVAAPNATSVKRADDAGMALKAIEDMSTALFDQGENTFSLIGDNPFTVASTRFEEAFGRLQSGGAITEDEEKRFARLRPKATDSEKIQRQKLADMREQLQSIYLNTGVPQYQAAQGGQVPAAAAKSPGGDVRVRVLPDGTRVKVRQVAPGQWEKVD